MFYEYAKDGVTFTSRQAFASRLIYFPLCGIDSASIKSAITPYLSGDIKTDKNHYLTKPVSREDLRVGVRNCYLRFSDGQVISLGQGDPEKGSFVQAGPLWHRVTREILSQGVRLEALSFVPVSGETAELLRITVTNTGSKPVTFTPTVAVPIFGRGLANKHDHEHVTALLHRITQTPSGVVVSPSMTFNEEGHKTNQFVYFVCGHDGQGQLPVGTFPTVESFYGDAGTVDAPEAVTQDRVPQNISEAQRQGKEAVGALRFATLTLKPGEIKEYLCVLGMSTGGKQVDQTVQSFKTAQQFDAALTMNQKYWTEKAHSIRLHSADKDFDGWMSWVTIQPVLRRIFGCSFLPDHDYGKGGKGWRDLWQDLLSLILIEPQNVRENLINNFGGVRIDGSNATIIGSKPGEFIADRNAISRVWMDHGAWPFLTTLLYIHQTGDYDILFEDQTYFRDPQLSRTFNKDAAWSAAYGNTLKNVSGKVYKGTILEHILVQNLVQFFNVGEHNITRLESADWNDGLDMAFARGESVTFMSFYGGNLLGLADLLEDLAKRKGISSVRVAKELMILCDSIGEKSCDYGNGAAKKSLLFDRYYATVQPELSGEQLDIPIAKLAADLRLKGQWIFEHIRRKEMVSAAEGSQTHRWVNGYYDNTGTRVEGKKGDRVWMTLTGQVFPLMSGAVEAKDVPAIIASVRRYLQDQTLGGFRLNTDFGITPYLDFGRAFGFAYGTKENGAFFSHMIVMYAYALYKRGFAKEGYEVLRSIYAMSADTAKSRIYPGVPEYFDSNGQGMYHYLTGSASWYVLTMLTQVFGVRGHGGNLVLEPKLVAAQFDAKGEASVICQFANRTVRVVYHNPKNLEYGTYRITKVTVNQKDIVDTSVGNEVCIERSAFGALSSEAVLDVTLG